MLLERGGVENKVPALLSESTCNMLYQSRSLVNSAYVNPVSCCCL